MFSLQEGLLLAASVAAFGTALTHCIAGGKFIARPSS